VYDIAHRKSQSWQLAKKLQASIQLRFQISNDWRRHFVHDVVIG
jgi:hypothetical protein